MTTAIITSPFNKISDKLSSHRGAQAFIYAAQLQEMGRSVTVDVTGDVDFNQYDEVYTYHGNDWGGSLNMFGGVSKWDGLERLANFCRIDHQTKVYSLAVDFPKYSDMICDRLEKASPEVRERWNDQVDLVNLSFIEARAPLVDTNLGTGSHLLLSGHRGRQIVAGDSHAISMYRPRWMVNSVPYSTLYGSLKKGLDTFVSYDPALTRFENIELYFGNIDIRHHLCRLSNPVAGAIDLAGQYVAAARDLGNRYGCTVKLYEPLPIEDESRKVPGTGFYKGTPFYGSWEQRNEVRERFTSTLRSFSDNHVYLQEWTKPLLNDKGQMSFDVMEKPRSIHLSREFYPHWQGRGINTTRTKSSGSVTTFMEEQ